MARHVTIAATGGPPRVTLTSHEAAGPVERRVMPQADVVTLDNGGLDRPRRAQPPPKQDPKTEPELPPEADTLAAAESELHGDAATVWADVLACADSDTLKRGKVRKQIGRTLEGRGLYVFVAAGMHSAAAARKAKGRAAARRTLVTEAARGRRSVAEHWPEHLPAFDAALRHALSHPAPLPPRKREEDGMTKLTLTVPPGARHAG